MASPAPDVPPAGPSRRSSGNPAFVGVGCGALLFFVCAGGATAVFLFYRAATESYSTDPAEIESTARTVGALAVPEFFRPELAINFDLPEAIADGLALHCAIYAADDPLSLLVFGHYKLDKGKLEPEAMRLEIEQKMRDRGIARAPLAEATPGVQRELTVRGKRTPFTFRKGRPADSDAEYVEVFGSFPGREGATGLFWLRAPADRLSADEAAALVESLQ